jgi:hypothetical protein
MAFWYHNGRISIITSINNISTILGESFHQK